LLPSHAPELPPRGDVVRRVQHLQGGPPGREGSLWPLLSDARGGARVALLFHAPPRATPRCHPLWAHRLHRNGLPRERGAAHPLGLSHREHPALAARDDDLEPAKYGLSSIHSGDIPVQSFLAKQIVSPRRSSLWKPSPARTVPRRGLPR